MDDLIKNQLKFRLWVKKNYQNIYVHDLKELISIRFGRNKVRLKIMHEGKQSCKVWSAREALVSLVPLHCC